MAKYEEKIKELEERIKTTKYNKKTQHAIGLYKAQLAKLKEKQEARSKKGPKSEGYSVRKTGDATVLLLGFPSVGKSTLLNALTNADSAIGSYAFTTLTVIPGLLEYKHAKIQVLDVPGVVRGAASGKGRGKEVLSVMRNADLAVIIIDANDPSQRNALLKEVNESHIRVNQQRPDVTIKKTAKDGLKIASTLRLSLAHETIRDVLKEFRINNADVLIRENISLDQLIDCIEDNKKYILGITVVNKIDLVSEKKKQELIKYADLAISAQQGTGIEELKEHIFKKLNFMRLFLKEPGKPADLEEPLIVFKGVTIKDVCEKLHKDMVKLFKFARVTGPSARFPGQKLSLRHVLKDSDILEIHLR